MSTCSHQERCWIYLGTWQHIQIGCDNQKRLFPNWTEEWMMNTDSFSAGGYDNTFSVQWENTICLICKTKLAVLKEYNLKRHYSTEHGEQYEKYKGDEGKKMRTTWRTTVSIRSFPQSEGRCCCRWNELCGKGIYRKSRKVIPRRTVSQGSHVASRLHLCPEKKSWFNKISSLANTAAERINELSGDMCEQLQDNSQSFTAISVALDESEDQTDNSQPAIFISSC